MPTVPLVRDNSVQEQALPGARVNTSAPIAAFGGGDALSQTSRAAGELATGLNAQVIDFAQKQKKNADDLKTQELDLEASKAQTDLQMKIRDMRGKDAFGAPDVMDKEWKKTSDAILSKATNKEQKDSLSRILSVRSADLYKSVNDHVSTEGKRYDDELTISYIKNAQINAANNYQDIGEGGQVDQSLFQQEQALRKYADRNGMPEELIKEKIAKASSETHSSVIEQMLLNNNDLLASQYYKDKKDSILPDDRVKLEKALEQSTLLGDSQREADKILSKFSDRGQAFNEAKKQKDPELRKKIEDNLDKTFARMAQADRAEQAKNYQMASQLVEQGKPVPGTLTPLLSKSQSEYLEKRAKQIAHGIEPSTDWTTYYHLKSMAADNKSGFSKENLLEYRHLLSDTEFKDMVNLQSHLAKNDPTAVANLNGFRTSNQIVNDTLISAGINVKSKDVNEMKKVSQFKRMVDEHLSVIQEQTGKKAKSEDVQKVADRLLINTIVKGGGFLGIMDAKKKAFELEYKDVPLSERNKIVSLLNSRKKPATEEAVLKTYIKALGRQ